MKKGPPFDGKPCPMCPVEIRNLFAVVHNYINAKTEGSARTTLEDLKDALAGAKPLVDAHFADRQHAYGELPEDDLPEVKS